MWEMGPLVGTRIYLTTVRSAARPEARYRFASTQSFPPMSSLVSLASYERCRPVLPVHIPRGLAPLGIHQSKKLPGLRGNADTEEVTRSASAVVILD